MDKNGKFADTITINTINNQLNEFLKWMRPQLTLQNNFNGE
jgi:hypothetical protein